MLQELNERFWEHFLFFILDKQCVLKVRPIRIQLISNGEGGWKLNNNREPIV